jgi:hypothetical protein
VRIRVLLSGIVLVVASTGCAQTAATGGAGASAPEPAAVPAAEPAAEPAAAVPASRGGWAEPPAYKFTLTSTCGERALIGRFRVTVASGAVTRTEGLDDAARKALMLRLSKLVPTLGQLLDEAATARRDGADDVVVHVDPRDGHPTSIRIDPSRDAIDDESCYDISDYSAG